jgi:pimeloyl-ACP methyl ester carboxylesterase
LSNLTSNADRWDDQARAAGIYMSRTPQVGAIAQWESGHVAVVERVNSDGTILISESSYSPVSGSSYDYLYNTRTISAASPSTYIHVPRSSSSGGSYSSGNGQIASPYISITSIYDAVDGDGFVTPGETIRIRGKALNAQNVRFYLGNTLLTQGSIDFLDDDFYGTLIIPGNVEPGNYQIKALVNSNYGDVDALSPVITVGTSATDPDGTWYTATDLGTLKGSSLSEGNNGGSVLSADIGKNYNHGRDLSDYYKFSIDSTRRINIGLNSLSANANIELRDNNNNLIASSTNPGNSVEAISRELNPGTYYVRVSTSDSAETNYNLRITELTGNIVNNGLTGNDTILDSISSPLSAHIPRFYNNGVNLYHYDSSGRISDGIQSNKDTIIVIHGRGDKSEGKNIKKLLTEAANKYTNYQVLGLDWQHPADDEGQPPWTAALSITPVANWAVNTLKNLGIASNQVTLFGHSLGAYVSAEIGRIFGKVKNLVALDPAYPGKTYDVDGNKPDDQKVWDFQDVANRSLAFVVKDAPTHIGGIAGDAHTANKAHDSLVIKYEGQPFWNWDTLNPKERATIEHGAVIDVFRNALSKNYLKLEDNLTLPGDHQDDWYGDSGDWALGGTHEGRITADRYGNINHLSYVYDTGWFNTPKEKQAWT